MQNMEQKYNKSLMLILLICLVFAFVIGSAYQYIPEKTGDGVYVNNKYENQSVNINTEENAKNSQTEEEANKEDSLKQEKETDKSKKSNVPTELETISIDEPPVEHISTNQSNVKATKSLDDYLETAKNSSDDKVKADAYEHISQIYASQKRYGTALAYAQKAYNISKSVNSEVLLARLYYKLGYKEKSDRFVESFVRKDFSLED